LPQIFLRYTKKGLIIFSPDRQLFMVVFDSFHCTPFSPRWWASEMIEAKSGGVRSCRFGILLVDMVLVTERDGNTDYAQLPRPVST